MLSQNKLDVKYGLYNLCEERDLAKASFGYIMSDFHDLKNKYIKLGFHLDEFNRFQYYKDFGYLTFEEFCTNNIPLDLGSISRCISVFQIFAEFDKESRVRKMWLDDKYVNFSYSQLVEMVPLDGDIRPMIKCDMTVKQIREVKKFIKANKNCGIYERRDKVKNFIANGCVNNESNNKKLIATSQPTKDKVYESFVEDAFINDLLMECKLFIFRNKPESIGILESNISGKRLTFKDSNGTEYMIQYSVSRKGG